MSRKRSSPETSLLQDSVSVARSSPQQSTASATPGMSAQGIASQLLEMIRVRTQQEAMKASRGSFNSAETPPGEDNLAAQTDLQRGYAGVIGKPSDAAPSTPMSNFNQEDLNDILLAGGCKLPSTSNHLSNQPHAQHPAAVSNYSAGAAAAAEGQPSPSAEYSVGDAVSFASPHAYSASLDAAEEELQEFLSRQDNGLLGLLSGGAGEGDLGGAAHYRGDGWEGGEFGLAGEFAEGVDVNRVNLEMDHLLQEMNTFLLPVVEGEAEDMMPPVASAGRGRGAEEEAAGVPEELRMDVPFRPAANEMEQMLMHCAGAVEGGNLQAAHRIMRTLTAMVSPHGTAGQRMAYYFLEGLAARIIGTGSAIYQALQSKTGGGSGPASKDMLKALLAFLEACPYGNFGHVAANAAILEAFEGEARVHIIDFGITHGTQWPTLIEALAERPGGPPHVRITGIDAPQTGLKPI
eukprot:jgi/Mesen1/3558/ME000199S02708